MGSLSSTYWESFLHKSLHHLQEESQVNLTKKINVALKKDDLSCPYIKSAVGPPDTKTTHPCAREAPKTRQEHRQPPSLSPFPNPRVQRPCSAACKESPEDEQRHKARGPNPGLCFLKSLLASLPSPIVVQSRGDLIWESRRWMRPSGEEEQLRLMNCSASSTPLPPRTKECH